MVDMEQLIDAVDRTRLMYWSMQGKQLDIDVKVFAEYLAAELDKLAPSADMPQPKTEFVSQTIEIGADIAETGKKR